MINTTKCIGCRKGIGVFTKQDDKLYHIDLFATREAGEMYPCLNQDTIEPHLYQNIVDGNKGALLPNDELKKFFMHQEWWWGDIISILYDIKNASGVDLNKFLTDMLDKSDEIIEQEVLKLADEHKIHIPEEDYPDLIKFKKHAK